MSKISEQKKSKNTDTVANPINYIIIIANAAFTFTLRALTGSLSKDTVRGKMTSSFRTTGSSTGDYTRSQVGETHYTMGNKHFVTTHYITLLQRTCCLSL